MRVIAYIRVSTNRQEIGPEVQKAAIEAKYGKNILWFEDIGISGSKPLTHRPALGRAIVELRKGDVFAVYRLDRVARDLMTQLVIEDQVMKAGAVFTSCTGEGTEDQRPEAKFFRQVMGAAAELERAMIQARVKAALDLKRARGERLGGHLPFGYDSQDGRLVPNQDEQKVISQILKYRSEGVTIRGVISKLNTSGIRTKFGKDWNISQVQKVIARHSLKII